jgi:hypothetical protein
VILLLKSQYVTSSLADDVSALTRSKTLGLLKIFCKVRILQVKNHMKNRKSIFITTEFIWMLVVLLAGIVLLLMGAAAIYRENTQLSLEELSTENCKKGVYVTDSIDFYVEKAVQNLGNGSYTGVSQFFYTSGKWYEAYTVPVSEQQYILVLVADREMLSNLEQFDHGRGDGVAFRGEIIENPIGVNDPWYEGTILEADTDRIIADYVIKVKPYLGERKKLIYLGALVVAAAIARMWGMKKRKDLT